MAKVINTPLLRAANRRSVKARQNRTLTDEGLHSLDPEGIHVVGFTMMHTNVEGTNGIRTQLLCKTRGSMKPVEAWLDFMPEDFNALPDHEQLYQGAEGEQQQPSDAA